jgi:ketosteroid isomerase-like protein
MSADEDAVLAANEGFYRAFNARDGEAMDRLWARDAAVGCLHPGWAPLRERAAVIASWRAIFRGQDPPRVQVLGARATVVGSAAWVVCYERIAPGAGGTMVATNVFVREAGGWRIAHHQAGTLAQPIPDSDLGGGGGRGGAAPSKPGGTTLN